jgi:uncharacterized caspase-like protein
MRAMGTIAWALFLTVLLGQPAFADKRVALVIGNSAYRNVARLTNPANDAAAMAATFNKAKFDVVDARNDLTVTEMRRVLRDFVGKARDADVAVIYYAGHGIEIDGTNYLIPTDAQLEADTDVFDEALPLDRVLVAVEPAKQLRLVILDACRDNPFSKTMKRTVGSRSVGRGLAKVEPSNPNTIIAFAAKAGFTASDGDSSNSPFALALSRHLTTPGLDLRKAFGFVRDDVLKATGNRQEPFIYGSLGGNDVSLVPAPAQAAPVVTTAPAATTSAPDSNAIIRHDYELAAQVGTKEAWDFFLSTYPDGFYAKLAQAQRNKIIAEEARLAATEKARLAAEEQARLAAEGAKASEQAKAEAQSRAAEQARKDAEKKKAAEDAKLAEAERAKAAGQAKAEEEARVAAAKAKAADDARIAREARAAEEARIAAEKKQAADDAKLAEADRALAAAQAKAEEEARNRAEKAAEGKNSAADKPIGPVAALAPPDQAAPVASQPVASDIPRLLQTELRRVGCNTGAVDGDWNAAAQKSLAMFNKSAGTRLDVKVASLDALDVVKSKTSRICPLVCDHGYEADGERCVKITCKSGYRVGDDNSCEKIESRKPVATRESPVEPQPKRAEPPAAKPAASAGGSGQIMCNNQGCRPVAKGCYIGRGGGGQQREVCH